jgi:TatD DNase family protein
LAEHLYIDSHCHLDRYPRSLQVLDAARALKVAVVAVTELPSAYQRLALRLGRRDGVRLALGMHPLRVQLATPLELTLFTRLLDRTDYVGEIGLDGSRDGRSTLGAQRKVFEHLLEQPRIRSKVLTVHSRGAEAETIASLSAVGVTAILHWYTGAFRHAEAALEAGFYFSVNAAMLRSKKGSKLLALLPRDRVVTETDGPYVKTGRRPSAPADVPRIVADLAGVWSCTTEEAQQLIWTNMSEIRAKAKQPATDRRPSDRLFD